jgi:ribosomal RNA assembly protein
MQEIYLENIREIVRSKSKLEKELGIKVYNKGKNIFVKGSPEKEFTALQVMEAIKNGFSAERALKLKQENFMIQKIKIKSVTKRNDLSRIKARLIGTKGKTLRTLKNLTECDFAVNDNEIGIIGPIEEIEEAVQAVTSLIHGSKQGNVYSRLEKNRKKRRDFIGEVNY